MATTFGRLSRGSRLQDAYHIPDPLPSLAAFDSAFQLQEYIALLVKADVHDVQRIVALPTRQEVSSATSSEDEGSASGGVEEERLADEFCWVYEQLRRVALDLSHPLLSALQLECNRRTCPEMKADEWLYLCVAHGNGVEHQCCAIDYIVHTLDSTTAVLNSPKSFPSRISIPTASRRHFHSLSRRLSRIFAHAYYHHREVFETCEAESSLYSRFYHLARTFDLVPAEFLIPPPAPPSASYDEPEDEADFSRRDSSHSLPHPEASALPSPKASPGLTGASENSSLGIPGTLARTETMFLSSEPSPRSPGILQMDQSNWPKQSSNPGVSGSDDSMSPIDDDGYDIVEGLSSHGLGDMMQGIEDDEEPEPEPETNVVVDEMDGAEESTLPPVDASSHHHSSDEDMDEMAHAVEEASKLPILHSGLSPGLSPKPDQVSFEAASSVPRSPLRSPRRGTLRQSDVSPSSFGSPTLPEEEPPTIALPAPKSQSLSPSPSASALAVAPEPTPAPAAAPVPVPSNENELEEVDLSSGPGIVEEEDSEGEESTTSTGTAVPKAA